MNKNALYEAQLGEEKQSREGLEAELAKLRERSLVMEQRLLALESAAARASADGFSSSASPEGCAIIFSNSVLCSTLFPGKMHLVVA